MAIDWVAAGVGVVGGGAFGTITTWLLSLKFIPAATKRALEQSGEAHLLEREKWERSEERVGNETKRTLLKESLDQFETASNFLSMHIAELSEREILNEVLVTAKALVQHAVRIESLDIFDPAVEMEILASVKSFNTFSNNLAESGDAVSFVNANQSERFAVALELVTSIKVMHQRLVTL